jgi:uroporphyrinogen decarboxylase
LVGKKQLIEHIRTYPDAFHHGLKSIQETTLRFIEAAKGFGIAGIFFAIQHASYLEMNNTEYQEFGVMYDLPLLDAVKDLWSNMAHIHGESIMFDPIAEYPVQILNWHDQRDPTLLIRRSRDDFQAQCVVGSVALTTCCSEPPKPSGGNQNSH